MLAEESDVLDFRLHEEPQAFLDVVPVLDRVAVAVLLVGQTNDELIVCRREGETVADRLVGSCDVVYLGEERTDGVLDHSECSTEGLADTSPEDHEEDAERGDPALGL